MQAPRLAFKDGITAPLAPEVLYNFGQDVLEVLERDDHAGVYAVKFHPTDVEGGAVQVAGVLGGGTVAAPEFGDAVVGAHDTGDLDAVLLAAALGRRSRFP